MYPSQTESCASALTLFNLTVSPRKTHTQFHGQIDPHQQLAGKHIFSKLDLKSAYWQFPMQEVSIEKTALSPGPGYGLWEFVVMLYGLMEATQTCQRGLDELFCECHDCVDNYVDNIIIFSDDMDS